VRALAGQAVAAVERHPDADIVALGRARHQLELQVEGRGVAGEAARVDDPARLQGDARDADVVGGAIAAEAGDVVDARLCRGRRLDGEQGQ
jgi:hypothetical protein